MFWLGFVFYLEVVLLFIGFDWQISSENGETAHFWQNRLSTPRRRSVRLGVGLRLGVGTHA